MSVILFAGGAGWVVGCISALGDSHKVSSLVWMSFQESSSWSFCGTCIDFNFVVMSLRATDL